MPRYKVADVVYEVNPKYNYILDISKKYEYNGDEKPCFTCVPTDTEIENEVTPQVPVQVAESLAVFRKLCEYEIDFMGGFVFHSSAVAVDGNAYLFTAPSGTGKSTHARNWRKYLGDKVKMVNDDKPLIRYRDGAFYVYGTPWNGKHRLGNNISAKIKAICILTRGKENKIEEISPSQAIPTIINQTLRYMEEGRMIKLLDLVDKLCGNVKLYLLSCNMDVESAKVAYEKMSGEKDI